MKKRNVALCVILSFITFGLFGYYWCSKMWSDMQALTKPKKIINPFVWVILSIFTLRISSVIWMYRMGDMLDFASLKKGIEPPDITMQLIMFIPLFPVVSWAVLQSRINKIIEIK